LPPAIGYQETMPAPTSARLWGSELSPFTLKLRACCAFAGLPVQNLPADGTRLENLRATFRIERAKRTRSALRYPRTRDLDEYPLVPFLLPARNDVLYDSSALARWLDDLHPAPGGALVPYDPALRFVASLVDEAFDEVGLYLVHHNRWVHSARTNDAGARLARELGTMLPPGMPDAYGRRFARRQVRRLPYLFSVAPAGYRVAGLAAALTPPSRPGFPPTHALLDAIWERWLGDVERILRTQPYLLGARFTLADASVYGALAMNLADPTTNERLQALAPTTHAWLAAIHAGRHVDARGPLWLSETLMPLLASIAETFVPLMRQNADAFADARGRGVSVWNERAFFQDQALYDGTLLGTPFRHVVKTFQVVVWQELWAEWAALSDAARAGVERLLPAGTLA